MGKSIENTVDEALQHRAAFQASLTELLGDPRGVPFHAQIDLNAPDEALRQTLLKRAQSKAMLDEIYDGLTPEKKAFFEEFVKKGARN